MKAVLDTNVLVSGLFFGGLPRAILDAWAKGNFELCVSPSIFDEYLEVCDRIADSRPNLEYRELLATLVGHGTLLPDSEADHEITADADDDKFMRCAFQAEAVVVSGDKHLLDVDGWKGVSVVTPRTFLDQLGLDDR